MKYKFQQGGGFNFQPYQSVFEPTGKLEIAQYMREKYDQNKENRDLVSRALATFETSPGDAHLVTKATDHINELLAGVDSTGAYERAGAVVSEAYNYLLSDKGLTLAKRSQDMRNKELAWQAEYQMKNPGARVLGFGDEAWKTHVSYKVNDDGSIYENIYQPTNEIQADYSAEMNNMLKRIGQSVDASGNAMGITQQNADMIGELMFNSYLGDMAEEAQSGEFDYNNVTLTGSDVGMQDYKRLMEIDLKHIANMEERHLAAIADIKKRIKFTTQQWVNQTAMSQNLKVDGVIPHDEINDLTKSESNVSVDASKTVDAILDNNANTLDILDNPNMTQLSKEEALIQYNIQQSLKNNFRTNALKTGLSAQGIDAGQTNQIIDEFNFYEGTGEGQLFEGHEELYILADFMTKDNDILDELLSGNLPIDMGIAGGEGFDPGQVLTDASKYGFGVGTGSVIAKKIFKKNLKGMPNFWKTVLTTAAGVTLYNGLNYKFTGFENVNDWLRSNAPEGEKGLLDYLNPIQNEVDFIKTQLTGQSAINYFNDLAGTNYTNNDEWAQNVDRVIALWEYRKRGGNISKQHGFSGTELQNVMNSQSNIVYDTNVITPDWSKVDAYYDSIKDSDFKTNFLAQWDQSEGVVQNSITTFKLAGSLTNTTDWHSILGYDSDLGLSQVDVDLVGFLPADISTNTPPLTVVSVKKADDSYQNYIVQGVPVSGEVESHRTRNMMSQLKKETLVIEDNARLIANHKLSSGKTHTKGQLKGIDVYNSLLEAYTTYNGGTINKEYAEAKASEYIIQSFRNANPEISSKIEQVYNSNPSIFVDTNGQGLTLADVYRSIIWNGSKEFQVQPYVMTTLR